MGSIPSADPTEEYDVIVIGGGNAGFSAASTAAQTLHSHSQSHPPSHSPSSSHRPPRILLLEKAPHPDLAGGNTFYTAGAYRFPFTFLADLAPLLNNGDGLDPELAASIDMPPYSPEDFRGDMQRVTRGRADVELTEVLVTRSRGAVDWMAQHGGRWELSFHRQAYRDEITGRWRFFGGLAVCFEGGGKGLVEWHGRLAEREGVVVWYGCEAKGLVTDGEGRVVGVDVLTDGRQQRLRAKGGVVLASGGFQASAELRREYLGDGWERARVRGCPYSTGDGHRMLFPTPDQSAGRGMVSAKRAGDYLGCHSVCWDAASPADGGDRVLTNQYTKSGYPLGIMVNVDGQRFVDEGQDLRNYTYAVFGRRVLEQPEGRAWQVWDSRGRALLRKEEYAADVTELIEADSLDALADKLVARGLRDKAAFLTTVSDFNDACAAFAKENPDVTFNPALKDGLSTQTSSGNHDLALPKTNWARPLTEPPFTAVEVTCGITFTFGGVAIVPDTAEVVDAATEKPIEGLYACGEVVGGLFWGNYPGGSGLTAGTVFGRIAGEHAARRAVERASGSSGK